MHVELEAEVLQRKFPELLAQQPVIGDKKRLSLFGRQVVERDRGNDPPAKFAALGCGRGFFGLGLSSARSTIVSRRFCKDSSDSVFTPC